MNLERRKAYGLPVQWTVDDEMTLLSYLRGEALNAKKLQSLFPDRSWASIKSKVRKLRIEHDLFGSSYRDNKEDFTIKVAQQAKPKIVFDAYAGAGHQTFKWLEVADTVYASEIKKSKLSQFIKTAVTLGFEQKYLLGSSWHIFERGSKKVFFFVGDAVFAAALIKVANVNIDLIDLDTCGSTVPILPTLLVLIKPKHVVITHGEFHSMRFKREDVLRRLLVHRDISENPFPMDVEEMSKELDKAVKMAALRAHNETVDSYWLNLLDEAWLGGKFRGMLRRYYKVSKPVATSDCINELSVM